jgi:hypothetical protein
MIITQDNSHNHLLHFVTFECQPSQEVRGKNTLSNEHCNKLSIRTTKKNIWTRTNIEGRLQGNCSHCKNRPRIDPARAKVFSTKDEAIMYCNFHNEAVIVTENTTEVIE